MPRPTIAEISLKALENNFKAIQKHVGDVAICPIVKADAYGHDCELIARHLSTLGVQNWGVHSAEEGVRLRQTGASGMIIILGGAYEGEASSVYENQLTPVIHGSDHLKMFLNDWRQLRGTPKDYPIHLKLDTGMGRLGVRLEQLADFLSAFVKQKDLKLDGVFAHLPMAEDQAFVAGQLDCFNRGLGLIREAGFSPRLCHHSNSLIGITEPKARYDLIRPGLILYGLYPHDSLRQVIDLKPVMRLVTRIVSIRDIPKDEGLSYGHTFVTQRPSRIATLPVGYADGYRRGCSNKAYVLIGGKRVAVVGRVCMDLTLVDVTDHPEIKVGDRVLLFGQDERGHLSVDELAQINSTISYEIVCGISPRVKRLAVESF